MKVNFFSYGVAVLNEHVEEVPMWPFIGQVGNEIPERSLFTLFVSWGAFSFLSTAGFYFKYVLFIHSRQSLTFRRNKYKLAYTTA